MRGGRWYADALLADAADDAALGRNPEAYAPLTFPQAIYHNDSSRGTFPQRYFQDMTNATSGLCLLSIGGEGPNGGPPGGYTALLGYQLGAALYSLEHRYYGESLPAPLTDASTLMTLSVDTEMADLAAFATFLRSPSGGSCKALGVVGGSYSGALSAWFREVHPELADFSWSSSGVVNATFFFDAFDRQIVTDLSSEDPACLATMIVITAQAEAMWDDPTQRSTLLSMFNTPDTFTREDFLWSLADSGAMGPQYGYLEAMCGYIASPASPLAAIKAFAKWTIDHYGPGVGGACYYSTFCLSGGKTGTDPEQVAQWPSQREWVFQTCRELAYWQVAYDGSIRSQSLTTDYFSEQCKAAFGSWIYADTSAFNAKYGGATPNATKVIALNGSIDPWQQAAVKATIDPVYYPMFVATCPECGHCGDLRSPSPTEPASLAVQHAAIQIYISRWAAEALDAAGR